MTKATKTPNQISKKSTAEETTQCNKKRGWEEIENLFETKKKDKKEQLIKEEKKRGNVKDKLTKEKFDRADEWVDDGLGGKYNKEGYTGRVEDGVRVFKAHVLSKTNAGASNLCPFDCDCCFI